MQIKVNETLTTLQITKTRLVLKDAVVDLATRITLIKTLTMVERGVDQERNRMVGKVSAITVLQLRTMLTVKEVEAIMVRLGI